MNPLSDLRARLAREGATPDVHAAIDAAVAVRREVRGGHREWAALCEDAGLLSTAFRELQLALRDDPEDLAACAGLAHHYRERGENARAAELLERVLRKRPADSATLAAFAELLRDDRALPRLEAALARAVSAGFPQAQADALRGPRHPPPDDDEEPPRDVFAPADADCIRFLTLFSGREDTHARQWARIGGDSGYSPVHEPFTPAVARHHFLGTYTVGVYPLRLDGTATFFALDLDIDKSALERALGDPDLARSLRDSMRAEGLRLLAVLRDLGCPVLFEDSGYKGRHLWVFLDLPEDAELLHFLGKQLLAWLSPTLPRGLHLEFFPKQGGPRGKGLGNLIKLPLGIHRRTGRRSLLLDPRGAVLADPFAALRTIPRLPRPALYAAVERLKSQVAVPIAEPAGSPTPAAPPTAPTVPQPPTGPRLPAWTEGDFEADPRIRHILHHCPVLAELKHAVDRHRRLTVEEQLVLIHSLGHVEGGPLAVNHLLGRCIDVAPEKLMKDRLKGNPVSCPSIRKKIPQVTRRVACTCPFDFARDRYPTPTLHLLTLADPGAPPAPTLPAYDPAGLAGRFAAIDRRKREVDAEHADLRNAFLGALRAAPDRTVAVAGGRWQAIEREGVEELRWTPDPATAAASATTPTPAPKLRADAPAS